MQRTAQTLPPRPIFILLGPLVKSQFLALKPRIMSKTMVENPNPALLSTVDPLE